MSDLPSAPVKSRDNASLSPKVESSPARSSRLPDDAAVTATKGKTERGRTQTTSVGVGGSERNKAEGIKDVRKPEADDANRRLESQPEEADAVAGAERNKAKPSGERKSRESARSDVPSSSGKKLTGQEDRNLQHLRDQLFGKWQRSRPQQDVSENEPQDKSTNNPYNEAPKDLKQETDKTEDNSQTNANQASGGSTETSHIEQLLSTTRDILRVLSEKTGPKPFDIERDPAATAPEPKLPALNEFLRIDRPWDPAAVKSGFGPEMSLSALEELVVKAEQNSSALQRFCDSIGNKIRSVPCSFDNSGEEQIVWMVKRLIVLRCARASDMEMVKDEKRLTTVAESMRSWLLALLDSFSEQTIRKSECDAFELIPLIVAMVRYSWFRLRVGDIILNAWDEGVLKDPIPLSTLRQPDCQRLLLLIAKAECILNFTSEVTYISEHEMSIIMSILSLGEFLAISVHRLSPLWVELLDQPRYPLNDLDQGIQNSATGNVDPKSQVITALGGMIRGRDFEVGDLNIERLTTIGGLTIRWTRFYDQHLWLDKSSKILFVNWFACPPCGLPRTLGGTLPDPLDQWYDDSLQANLSPDVSKYPFRSPGSTKILVDHELCATWILLFGRAESREELKKLYQDIDVPDWLRSSAPRVRKKDLHSRLKRAKVKVKRGKEILSRKTMAGLMDPDSRRRYPIIYYHLGRGENIMIDRYQEVIPNAERLNYADFPIYEHRLRTLRAYMDTARPRGLRKLWRDNRDSLAYYTFWSAVTFGLGAVILAITSLAVSIAQTAAAFKALHLPSSG